MKNLIKILVLLLVLITQSENYAIAQWQQTNGPGGGYIQCFAVIDSNIYAGGWGGVYLSTNNGSSWTALNTTGLTNLYVRSLAIMGSNIFAGTWGGGVFLSSNNGASWAAVNIGLPSSSIVYSLVFSGSYIYAGTGGGVFLSTNNGASWTAMNTGLTNTNVKCLAISGSNIFAGTVGGVFLSTNNGASWVRCMGLPGYDVRSLTISGSTVFAGTAVGVFLSTNNGASWTPMNTGLTNYDVKCLVITGNNIFAGTGTGIFSNTINGAGWTAVNNGLVVSRVVLSLANIDNNIFAGFDGGGVFLSTNNGSSWNAANDGLTISDVHCLAINGNKIFAGTFGGVFLSTNSGASWTAVNTGLENYAFSIGCLAINDTNIFAGTFEGVFLSTNDGESWTAVNNGLTNIHMTALAINGSNIFAGTNGGGVFLSTNNGANWTEKNNGIPPGTWVHALTISGSNIFAGTDTGIFLSTNNGASWTEINTGLTNTNVFAFAISDSNIFAGTYGGGVFLSTNNGASWAPVNTGLTNANVYSLAIRDSNIFAGTSGGGVFLSTNNGATWTSENTSTLSSVIYTLATSYNYVFAGSLYHGVWKRPLTHIGQKPSLTDITPKSVGNTNEVTLNVYGYFPGNITLRLTKTGHPDIVFPDSTTGVINYTRIRGMMNLSGADTGAWNVVVTIPGDTTMVLPNALNITTGIKPIITTQIIGSPVTRTNTWHYYSIACTNSGNLDATGVPIWLVFPNTANVEILSPIYAFPPELGTDTLPSVIPIDSLDNQPIGNDSMMCYIVAKIPPHSTGFLYFRLKSSVIGNFKLYSWATPPLWASPFDPGVADCINKSISYFANAFPPAGCVLGAAHVVVDPYIILATTYDSGPDNEKLLDYTKTIIKTIVSCAALANPISFGVKLFKGLVSGVLDAESMLEACASFIPVADYNKTDLDAVAARDPNIKVGPFGAGPQRYYNSELPFPYQIFFENADSATAPAQIVSIIDTLNTNVYDYSSFEFGFITIGDNIITVPPGQKHIAVDHYMPSPINLVVRINAQFNESSGIAQWNFTSLDPNTLQPITDPLGGFLPPNVTAPEGEGSVSFLIKAKDTISQNAIISNKASIIFDNNDPIPTNIWSNKVDKIPPESNVNNLPTYQYGTSFPVTWSGTDMGSGVRHFTIYYSRNSGNYEKWLVNTKETSAIFTGEQDSTYHFYSIAVDSVGNVELAPLNPDAATTITSSSGILNIDAGQDTVVECTAHTTTPVELSCTVENGNIYSILWYAPGIVFDDPTAQTTIGHFPAGTTKVWVTATEGTSEAKDSLIVKVEDTTPPVITLSTQNITIWPPNHGYHTIYPEDFILSVTDNCDAVPGISVLSVSSDEPEDAIGSGDGATLNDIIINCPNIVQLRAERKGSSNGRVYKIIYAATDDNDNQVTAICKVNVPKNGQNGIAIDGPGPGYSVNGLCDGNMVIKSASPQSYIETNGDELPRIYPNPAKDNLIVEISVPMIDGIIFLYNMQGQLLLQQKLSNVKTEIDIKYLAKDLYMIRLITNEVTAERKFVKE